MPRAGGDPPHPLDHRLRATTEAMKAARAARPAQQRTLDAQHIDGGMAIGALRDQIPRFIDARLGHARMPQQLNAFIRQFAEQGTVFAAQPRQRAATAAA